MTAEASLFQGSPPEAYSGDQNEGLAQGAEDLVFSSELGTILNGANILANRDYLALGEPLSMFPGLWNG